MKKKPEVSRERKRARASVREMTRFVFFFLVFCCSSSANHDPRHFTLLLQCVNTACMGAIQ